MAISDKDIEAHVRETVADEGNVRFMLAPLANAPGDLPPRWREALAASDPALAVLDVVWAPLAKTFPKTIAVMRKTLHRVGLLTTEKRGASLVYVFAYEDDGGPCFWRGHAPTTKLPDVAAALPQDFTNFYDVHDGWLDELGNVGPAPSSEWRPLGSTGPSRDFLVTFIGHGPGDLGFDLTEDPPTAWTVWNDGKPSRVKDVAKEIDAWITAQVEDLAPVPARKKKKKS